MVIEIKKIRKATPYINNGSRHSALGFTASARWGVFKDGVEVARIFKSNDFWEVIHPTTSQILSPYSFIYRKKAFDWAKKHFQ